MVGLKVFVQLVKELLHDSDRKLDKLVAKGDAALEEGQPVVAAMHFTDAYGILARMHDPFVIPFQISIAKKLIEAFTQQGDDHERVYWESVVVELQRELDKTGVRE